MIAPPVEPKCAALFQAQLLGDEELLWCGQPSQRKHFTRTDFFIIPITLLWTVGVCGGYLFFLKRLALDSIWGIFRQPPECDW